MAKVYEAMLLAQGNAPEATKKFLTDFNFSENAPANQGAIAIPDPEQVNDFTVTPEIVADANVDISVDAVDANVIVASTIADSVDSFAQSVMTATPEIVPVAPEVSVAPVMPVVPEAAITPVALVAPTPVATADVESNPQYVPADFRAEFLQLSEIILKTTAKQKLQAMMVCGLESTDNPEFVVENLCYALAENPDLRIARFDLTAPATATLQSLPADSFRIRIHKTPIPNLCNITSVSGAIPLSRLFMECDVPQLMEMLAQRFNYVIVRADAVNAVPEVAQLAAYTDGVILVAQKESMAGEQMAAARESLRNANAKILGAVVNRVREAEPMQRVA